MKATTVSEIRDFLRCPYGQHQRYPLHWYERIARGLNADRNTPGPINRRKAV